MSEAATIVVSSLVGGGVAFVGAVIREVFGARRKIDEALRQERVTLYKELWKITGRLPEWPRAELTYADLEATSGELRDWYFEDGGGIYLSATSRARYNAVQERITAAAHHGRADAAVEETDYDGVRERCSDLRDALTADLTSRRGRSVLL